ncbi:isochorismatase family cysteine hydrolase [Conexibacter stalactiti]|uniref:Isochorismatase family cysteine hydrolase n=1 Tax=Conexibacter stalactiti TaxID=1940611 RepID=A0ABU4HL75_9ACTN|nr:isochorismatase family cysteine hydrolase [Conexibacter stalactiti]MDW5594038.1 isochorismatase family cysteine hydrolase [Conexibacter stalactiti]MEC5034680.1 isochorismatase family cysteine hydrolase [Conexibacter stalactiti]
MVDVTTGETYGDRGQRPALLVVDMQNDFVASDGVFAQAGLTIEDPAALVGRVAALADRFRAAGGLVVWVKMVWDDDAAVGLLAQRSPFLATAGLRRGSRGAELVDGLRPRPGDAVVEKTRFSAFHATELERLLADEQVETVVVCGVRTDFCVESTVRDAFFRDLAVLVADDAVGGYFPALHDSSLRVMGTVFAEVLGTDAVLARTLAPHDPQSK